MNDEVDQQQIQGADEVLGGGAVTFRDLAVAGIEVTAVVAAGERRGETIARAVTDAGGAFVLEADSRLLHRLRCLEVPLSVRTGSGRTAVAVPLEDQMALRLPDDADAGTAPWPRIAQMVRTSIAPTLGTLAVELRTLSPTGAFRDLTVAQRLAAYGEVVAAVREAGFEARDGVDVEGLRLGIDAVALGRRNLKDAILVDILDWMKHRDRFGDLFPWVPDTGSRTDPLIGYRDYLLDLLVKAQQGMIKQQPPLTTSQYVSRLENRFHQGFRTRDLVPVAAAENVARVLEAVLVAPAGPGYGIGLPPASIPPRGSLPATQRVAQLVGLTGLSPRLVSNRWRIEVDLPADQLRSPVEQNIVTLQRVMSDTAQQQDEPWSVAPDLQTGGTPPPIFTIPSRPEHFHFLRYEEWLEQRKPAYFENLFDIRATATLVVSGRSRELLKDQRSLGDFVAPAVQQIKNSDSDALQYARCVVDAFDQFGRGVASFAQLRYEEAIDTWQQLDQLLDRLRVSEFGMPQLQALKRELRGKAVTTAQQLAQYEAWSQCIVGVIGPETQHTGAPPRIGDWPNTKVYWASRLALLKDRVLPIVLAEAHLKLGNYRAGVDLVAPVARFAVMTDDIPGIQGLRNDIAPPQMLADGAFFSSSNTERGSTRTEHGDGIPHTMEQAFNRLRLGEALLAWADSLYRSDEPEDISRAREAYKAVMYLHGSDPDLDPQWVASDYEYLGPILPIVTIARGNPAMRAQVNRARAALLQIEGGLNFFGTGDAYVPPVRYTALRQVAERFATGAKSAQNDFLTAIDGFERGVIDEKQARAAVRKADAAIAIATEEETIAQAAVQQVQAQIDALKAQAAAKRKEYEDADSFWSQVKSAATSIAGAKDDFAKLAGPIAGSITGGAGAGAAGTVGLTDIGAAAASKDALGSMTTTLGAGFGATAGIALFVYKGVQGLESWTDGLTKLKNEFEQIEKVAIPAAEKVKALKQREVRITQLRAEIARADADLGRELLKFYTYRVLNRAFWLALARLSSDLLRRYLDLGARHAWLAQQALAFETASPVRIVAMDYANARMRNIGGADRLLMHLAELEAVRIASLGTTVPVKWRVSLSSYAPRAFAALRANGLCTFVTREDDIRMLHPGVYGLRLRAVGVEVKVSRLGHPPRGILVNSGVSFVSDAQGQSRRLTRYVDGVALSDFSLRDDMAVYSLPDETLLPFEGSGVETAWRIELPPYDELTSHDLLDLVITFDVRGRYSPALHAAMAAQNPAPRRRAVAASVQSIFAKSFADLVSGVDDLDVTLPAQAFVAGRASATQTITGVAVAVVGDGASIDVELAIDGRTQIVNVPADGAASGVGTMSGVQPLDALVGADLTKQLNVTVVRAGQPAGALDALRDVVVVVDFEEA
jgi:hypothetical protein